MNKKQKLLSPEERRDEYLKSALTDLRYVPEPTYFFTKGTPVSIGSLTDVVIENSFFDGKLYEVDYTDINHNYGDPIVLPHQKKFFKWTDIRPISKEKHNLVHNEDLRLSYSQRSIDGLLLEVYHPGLDLDPEYQRGYVWELEDKVALIDSIFNNVDIGKFVVSRRDWSTENKLYEIIDGKQRVNAICEFYEDKFEYNGYTFSDLGNAERNHFLDYPISYAEIEESTREQKLRYFVMLNKYGKAMDRDHLKKVEDMLNEYA